ncbi:MAG: NADH-quinone oxidoreductase subunit L, partial [Ramlibacter sp.]|nr:NADH-quinone oxidoreductase subunit L [Ramlibacter sp.]
KDSIIEAVHFSKLPGAGFAYFAVLAGVFVTAFYSLRLYYLVFHGKERYHQNPQQHGKDHDHAGHDVADSAVTHGANAAPAAHVSHDAHDGHETKPRESSWVVTAPLLLLAFPSVVIGFLAIQPMLFGDLLKDSIIVDSARHPAMAMLAREFHGAAQMALHGLVTAPFWLAVAGVALAYYMYLVNPALPAAIRKRVEPVYQLLENKYYLDWFNENVLARGARMLGVGLWKGGDQGLIDGVIVNGSWRLIGRIAGAVRWIQSGYLYHYAFGMILGVFVLMTYFVWLNK